LRRPTRSEDSRELDATKFFPSDLDSLISWPFHLTKLNSKRNRPRLLLLAPGSWIHSRRALRAALIADFDTVFVDLTDPKVEEPLKYTFISLPRSGYSLYRRVLADVSARRLRDRILMRWFKNLWKRVAPDVVHVCWIDYRAAFCSRVGMAPLILSAWGSDINAHFETGSATACPRELAIEALSGASLTIVDGPDIPARCEMLTGRPIPAEMLHLGVDTDRFCGGLCSERFKLRAQLNISHDDVLLSSMRALSPVYNHDLILEAFASSLPKLRRKTFLLFKTYNADSSYLEMLRRKTREYGITDRVRFVDEVPHTALPSLYAATDFVINIPRRDSIPVTLLEAAACQRAVICNRLEAYSSIPDENITWIPTNDCLALSAAITDRTNGYRYCEESFKEAREAIIAGFSELKYQDRIAAIYRRLALRG
jgi:glycosyltransferase involved in cell wall biosynthesis